MVKLLRENHLRGCASQLNRHGVKTVADLMELDEEDFPALDLKLMGTKKLRRLLAAQQVISLLGCLLGPGSVRVRCEALLGS